ncbi:MAG: molybdate ABC transporter substrate-binding protein [Nocardioidaceae bacterium]
MTGAHRRTRRQVAGVLAGVACGALALGGCGGQPDSSGGDGRQVVVLAASSLTEAFGELEKVYEDQHPGVDVKLSFDSSSVLAEQVTQGNPADVLATADERTMGTVTGKDLTDGAPKTFATNTLVLVTPPDNPARLRGIEGLDTTDATYAACVPEAPCGAATRRLLDLDGVAADPTTEEQNVKGVLTKVTLGAVDAGLVYRSDARAAGDKVHTIEVDNASKVVNSYPIAVLGSSDDVSAARDWVDLVRSDRGQKVLRSYGFGPASAG